MTKLNSIGTSYQYINLGINKNKVEINSAKQDWFMLHGKEFYIESFLFNFLEKIMVQNIWDK